MLRLLLIVTMLSGCAPPRREQLRTIVPAVGCDFVQSDLPERLLKNSRAVIDASLLILRSACAHTGFGIAPVDQLVNRLDACYTVQDYATAVEDDFAAVYRITCIPAN